MSTVTATKNTLDGINTRLNEAQSQVSDLENKVAENTLSEQKGKK